MKRCKFNKGDRVRDDGFLGDGTVTDPKPVPGLGEALVQVLFDKTPPLDYNCGQNPCCQFKDKLTLLSH